MVVRFGDNQLDNGKMLSSLGSCTVLKLQNRMTVSFWISRKLVRYQIILVVSCVRYLMVPHSSLQTGHRKTRRRCLELVSPSATRWSTSTTSPPPTNSSEKSRPIRFVYEGQLNRDSERFKATSTNHCTQCYRTFWGCIFSIQNAPKYFKKWWNWVKTKYE